MSKRNRHRRQARAMTLYALDSAAAAAMIRERLASRQWWAFVTVGNAGLPLLVELESRHYAGKANRDYEMLGFPSVPSLGVVGIALARKRRMSARQLSKLFDEAGMEHEAETIALGERDAIALAPSQAVGERAGLWLMQLVSGETVRAG